jgi:flagellar basal-body rod protein FlgC
MQSLDVFSVAQQVSANNVANVSTEGFQSSRVDLEETAAGGVAVADIRQSSEAGPLLSSERLETNAYGQVESVPTSVMGSNTDIGKEMVDMMVNQAAFGANVSAVRTWDQMTGALLDMVV